METRKTKQHEILKLNVALAGTIPNKATEVDNGRGRKRLRHDADHLSSQRKKKDVTVVLVTAPEKVQESRERSLEVHVP